jgi:ankyrin repeat protein
LASEYGRIEVVKVLLAAHADVNAKAPNGATALMMAASRGHVDVVRALLAAHADVSAKMADGRTAGTIASQNGHPELAQLLLGTSPDQSTRFPPNPTGCSTSLTVELETFGEGVTIELRRGIPGTSTMISRQQSSGGRVYFNKLCSGSYFMAIGNEDDVDVTPVRQFNDNAQYQSRIVVQRGNISRKSRKTL